ARRCARARPRAARDRAHRAARPSARWPRGNAARPGSAASALPAPVRARTGPSSLSGRAAQARGEAEALAASGTGAERAQLGKARLRTREHGVEEARVVAGEALGRRRREQAEVVLEEARH